MDAEEWKAEPAVLAGRLREAVSDRLSAGDHPRTGALPVADRVAAFDNDGTLACEKPQTAWGDSSWTGSPRPASLRRR